METVDISLDLLDPPLIPRSGPIDAVKYQELVDSIREKGILQPLIVTPNGDRWRVSAGWRRATAAREAGLLTVPCVVKTMDENDEVSTTLIENLHREDLHPVEEGAMMAAMHEGLHLTVAGISVRVGKSPTYVSDRLAVVRGPEDVRDALLDRTISLSVALELIKVQHDGDRRYLLYHAVRDGTTSQMMREWVKDKIRERQARPDAPTPQPGSTPYEEPPVVMTACEWHLGQYPASEMHYMRVCPACFLQLQGIRRRLEDQSRAEEEVSDDGSRQGAD